MKKLIKIQNELKVPKGNFNSFGKYKYRSAEDILEAIKPILLANDCYLTLTDEIVEIGGKLFLKATATIKDEKDTISINGFAEMGDHKGMSSEQCTGTASSYARKYALNGLFLIDETESDPDSKDNAKDAPKAKNEVSNDLAWLNKGTEQFDKVKVALKDGKATMEDVRKKFKVSKEVETLLNS
jgi:hypothetical protein